MKKFILTVSFIGVCFLSYANNTPKVGDVLIVKAPSNQFYNHIAFPQLNILVKRGKIACYTPVIGNKVVVDEVFTKSNNKTYVVLKKNDGTKFFGLYTGVKANYQKAIDSGELELLKS
jgi:hypothetical protein